MPSYYTYDDNATMRNLHIHVADFLPIEYIIAHKNIIYQWVAVLPRIS